MPTRARPRWVVIVAGLVRRLPPRVVRVLVGLDVVAGNFLPWAWFLYYRWTGIKPSLRESFALMVRTYRFFALHLANTKAGTGALNVDWSSPPVRSAVMSERVGHRPKGSCGTCRNCCTTYWLPEGKRVSCPFLGEKGCLVYGGVYWDYFNCGRYPETPADLQAYGCRRFSPLLEPRRRTLPILAPALGGPRAGAAA